MKDWRDFAIYVSISAGMALAASSFMMLAALFGATSILGALVAIPIAGGLAMVVAGSVGGLASLYPAAPGIGVYLGKAFGARVSLVVVLTYVAVLGCLAGGESFLFARMVDQVLPGVVEAPLAATGILCAVVAINLCGVELPLRLQVWGTAALIVVVVLLSCLPLFSSTYEGASLTLTEPRQVDPFHSVTAIGMGVFLFMGFEWITPLGRKPSHYDRLIPLAMPIAIIVLVAAYTLFALSLAGTHAVQEISATTVPQFLLASTIASPFGKILALCMCILAMVNTFNAGLVGASRLLYGLAREGSLPRWCSTISLRTGTPTVAILLAGGLAVGSSVVITRFDLTIGAAAYAAAVECFVYAAVMFAWLKLRKVANRPRAFRSPFPRALQLGVGLVMPVLGAAALFADPEHWRFSVLFFLVSTASITVASVLLHRRKDRTEPSRTPAPEVV